MRDAVRTLCPLPFALAICVAGCAPRDAADAAPGARPVEPMRADAGEARRPPLEELALLEAPGRDEWQQPDRIMDRLGIADGSRVADIGAGSGWFTARLSRRVGPNGRVYAVDIEPVWIEYLTRRIAREQLTNVVPVLATPDDPRLPANLQTVLIVNTYAEMTNPVAVLAAVAASLAPGGRVGVIDFKPDGSGGPGPPRESRVGPDKVEQDAAAAGLRPAGREVFLRYQFLVVMDGRRADAPPAR